VYFSFLQYTHPTPLQKMVEKAEIYDRFTICLYILYNFSEFVGIYTYMYIYVCICIYIVKIEKYLFARPRKR